MFCSMLAAVVVTSCSKDESVKLPSNEKEPITIGLSTTCISYEDLPTSKSSEGNDLLAAQIYEVNGDDATPYAKGLFKDWSSLSFEGYTNTTYKVVATMVVDGENKIAITNDVYSKPFESAVAEAFEYSDVALEGLSSSTATLVDGIEYSVPNIDRYFGIAESTVTEDNSNIATSLKRVAFGVKTEGIDDDVTLKITGAPEVTLSAGEMEVFSLEDLEAAYSADETSTNYREVKSVELIRNDASVKTVDVEFFRNKLAKIIVNTVTGELGFDFEIPFESMIEVGSDNLYYGEYQLSTEKTYWVNVEGSVADGAIEWFVDEASAGFGAEFTFSATNSGAHTVKYVVDGKYLENGEDVTKSTNVKVYSSKGVYTLNEPNMTASEGCRGVDQYLYGEDVVTRFIEGDYTMFGTTNQYISSSNGYIYCAGSYSQSGVSFSKFDALTGEHKASIQSLPESSKGTTNYVFEAINETQAVATSSNGAYLVDLDTFTAGEKLANSKGAKSVLVADGYIFMIVSSNVVAYSIDNLQAEPIVIEGTAGATLGFVQSKDGSVWAASNTDFIRINTRDLTASKTVLPNGSKLMVDSFVFKQVSWVASTIDNTFFYATGSAWGAAYVWKYDINSGECTQMLASKEDLNGYMCYSTMFQYDAERDHLVCQTLQGYKAQSNLGINIFDVQSGELNKEVLYSTVVDGYEGAKDLRFPAMMTPIKNY